jgi:hypothetical protein
MLADFLLWITTNSHLLVLTSALGVLLFASTLFLAPWLIAQLPADYFINQERASNRTGLARWSIWLSRNVIGTVLIGLGAIMLLTPGPGVLMLITGLTVCDFERKHQLILKLAQRPRILASLNWMRAKSSKPPFSEKPPT